jgi:pilus assembly protein Flp/PilA
MHALWLSEREFWMVQLISRFLRDESGATAIEYCLIAAGLSIVIVTAVNGIGTTLSTNFATINTSLK